MLFKCKKLQNDGFSLVELMTIIAIIGLLLVVNYSSKQVFFDSNRQAQAKTFLLNISIRQAGYWQRHGSYAETLSGLGVNTPNSVGKHYNIQLEQAFSPAGYIIKAIPHLDSDKEKTFWLNHLGVTSENWNF